MMWGYNDLRPQPQHCAADAVGRTHPGGEAHAVIMANMASTSPDLQPMKVKQWQYSVGPEAPVTSADPSA